MIAPRNYRKAKKYWTLSSMS